MRLANKIAVITGGGSGIGAAAVQLFAREGAKVAIWERNEKAGVAAADAVRDSGGEAFFIPTDLTEPDSVARAVRKTTARFGRIDVLYNNGGGSTDKDKSITEIEIEDFWSSIKLNLFGAWLPCRCVIPEMIRSGGGSIINTVSVMSMVGFPSYAGYAPAKGGVGAMTRALAVEYAPHKIRVNAVAPGATRSERIRQRLDSDAGSELLNKHLHGWVDPVEIAYAALYFASDEARVTTGQILCVDSGYTAA